jgi:hypothetical protein
LLDIQRNLHCLVGKTRAGPGISRPHDPGGLIETYPDLARDKFYTQAVDDLHPLKAVDEGA